MIVLGGGIIGSEYASFFAALGTEVIVIDKKEQMLPYLDKEIGQCICSQRSVKDWPQSLLGNREFEEIIRHQGWGRSEVRRWHLRFKRRDASYML